MNTNVQNPPPSAAAVPTAVDRHLLTTVGTAPGVATRTDIMHAVAQIAREQLSERWVKGDSADKLQIGRRLPRGKAWSSYTGAATMPNGNRA